MSRDIVICWPRIPSVVEERAKLARVTKDMLPLPAGYVPVRFDDGSRLLVHRSYIKSAPEVK